MATIFVTGGAGYIGSHTVGHLLAAGHRVVAYDDLSSGHRAALPPPVALVTADLGSGAALAAALAEHRPDAVVHFAASIEAAESMTDPSRFWNNNVVNSLRLLDALVSYGGLPVVFSSSAAVYGEPSAVPIPEDAPKEPTNPYGRSKLVTEQALADYARGYGVPSVSLRYFNACGARPDGGNGPDHKHKTHLLTLAMLTALGRRPSLSVFGRDWPTRDGTCVRDYIHVEDLAAAHLLALDALFAGATGARAYNVGLGAGFTVLEVIDAVRRVTGTPVPTVDAPRRDGDPAALVADASLITAELGWKPRFTDLDQIVATAWRWHTTHPTGFAS